MPLKTAASYPISSQLGDWTLHRPATQIGGDVGINEPISEEASYGEILSLITLFTVPVYTTHTYVLNYTLLSDFKTIKEDEYQITEKAISGLVAWLLFPVMYPFWDDIKLNLNEHGPRASIVKKTTNAFLLETHRAGLL